MGFHLAIHVLEMQQNIATLDGKNRQEKQSTFI